MRVCVLRPLDICARTRHRRAQLPLSASSLSARLCFDRYTESLGSRRVASAVCYARRVSLPFLLLRDRMRTQRTSVRVQSLQWHWRLLGEERRVRQTQTGLRPALTVWRLKSPRRSLRSAVPRAVLRGDWRVALAPRRSVSARSPLIATRASASVRHAEADMRVGHSLAVWFLVFASCHLSSRVRRSSMSKVVAAVAHVERAPQRSDPRQE